jgi:signal transduction histidine kinase
VIALPEDLPSLWRVRMPERPKSNLFAVLTVADSGPGVPLDERMKIFEKFHQVPSAGGTKSAAAAETITARARTSLAAMGSGLGLTISKTIVEAHLGAIWVTENEHPAVGGRGSVFHVLLPIDTKAPMVEPVASAPL